MSNQSAVLLVGVILFTASVLAGPPVAEVVVSSSAIQVSPLAEEGEVVFVLAGESGYRFETLLPAGEPLYVPFLDDGAGQLEDGVYIWEVRLIPPAYGVDKQSAAPSAPAPVQQGRFRLAGAEVELLEDRGLIDPALGPEPEEDTVPPSTEDVVYNENIIARSACFSSDALCADGEALGIIDVKMKGNIPLIRWERTVAGDKSWDVDVDLGGFRIAQVTDGRAPMLIADAAPTNSLRVDGFGRVGFGTANPAENLHVVDSSDSSLRLQVGAQAWDIFTGSGSTALRVFNASGGGIPLVIATNGDVGVGPSSPSEALHVQRSNGTSQLLVEEASATTADRVLLRLRNKGGTALRFEDTANSLTAELRTNGSGLEVSGDFAVLSSREAKRITGSVEPQRILSQMLRLPLEFWHYKDDPSRRVHLGPMAEDWSEAFTFGGASETLSLVDATGVTIAAIQGLHAELRDRDRSIAALEAANAELRSQLAELSGLVARLVEQHEVGLARSP